MHDYNCFVLFYKYKLHESTGTMALSIALAAILNFSHYFGFVMSIGFVVLSTI